MHLLVSRMIQQAIARGRQEPTLGIFRNTVARPRGQCGHQRVRQRIFSGCNITRARCEQRHESPVRFARYRFDRAVRRLMSSSLQR